MFESRTHAPAYPRMHARTQHTCSRTHVRTNMHAYPRTHAHSMHALTHTRKHEHACMNAHSMHAPTHAHEHACTHKLTRTYTLSRTPNIYTNINLYLINAQSISFGFATAARSTLTTTSALRG